jgi:hypothetical protein
MIENGLAKKKSQKQAIIIAWFAIKLKLTCYFSIMTKISSFHWQTRKLAILLFKHSALRNHNIQVNNINVPFFISKITGIFFTDILDFFV